MVGDHRKSRPTEYYRGTQPLFSTLGLSLSGMLSKRTCVCVCVVSFGEFMRWKWQTEREREREREMEGERERGRERAGER